MAEKLYGVSFFFVVDQRPVEIGVEQQVAQIVLAHQLWVLVAAEGLNLPASRTVIGLDGSHPLQRERFAQQVGALVLLQGRRRKSAAAIEFAKEPDRLD